MTVFPDNLARGLPTHRATVVLIDPENGELLAVMDGRYLTEARTAAVSAVSAKLLAAPGPTTLAILGSGVQARSHVDALARVSRPRRGARLEPDRGAPRGVRRGDGRQRLRARSAPWRPPTPPRAARPHRAHDGRDDARASSADVADGAHVCAVGACRPDQREMDGALVARARVFVDSREAALHEAGDLVIPDPRGALRPGPPRRRARRRRGRPGAGAHLTVPGDGLQVARAGGRGRRGRRARLPAGVRARDGTGRGI